MIGKDFFTKFSVPPHIFWPGLVIFILLFSIAANVILVVQARSDGGAQIIDGYYERSVDWDDDQAMERQSLALGWKVDVVIRPAADGGHIVSVKIATEGETKDLKVFLELRDPTKIAVVGSGEATHLGEGLYVLPVELPRSGLFDVVVRAKLGTQEYLLTHRVDVDP